MSNPIIDQICHSIKENEAALREIPLQKLPLWFIEPEDVKGICNALQCNTVVSSLGLRLQRHDKGKENISNNNDDEQALDFSYLEALFQKNNTIQELFVSTDSIEVIEMVCQCFQHRQKLHLVWQGGNTNYHDDDETKNNTFDILKVVQENHCHVDQVILVQFPIGNKTTTTMNQQQQKHQVAEVDHHYFAIKSLELSLCTILGTVALQANNNDDWQSLESLQISACSTTTMDNPLLCYHLLPKSLKRLHISEMELPYEVIPHFVENFPELQELILPENDLGNRGCQVLASSFSSDQARSSAITILNLQNNQIATQGIITISGSAHLTHLNLSENFINSEAAAAIATHMTQLQHLFLRNMIGGISSGTAQAISSLPSLQSLDLSENRLSATTMAKLSIATSITKLYLQSCQLSDTEIMTWMDSNRRQLSICNNRNQQKLQELYLDSNPKMTMNSVTVLMETLLAQMWFLSKLVLDDTNLTDLSSVIVPLLPKTTHLIYVTQCHDNEQILHYLHLNKAGRRILRCHDIPNGLWSYVLARANQEYGSNAIYHLLCEKSDCIIR